MKGTRLPVVMQVPGPNHDAIWAQLALKEPDVKKDQEKWEWFNYLYKKLYASPKGGTPAAALNVEKSDASPPKKEDLLTEEKTARKHSRDELNIPKALDKKLGYWH